MHAAPLRIDFDDAPSLLTGLAVSLARPVVVIGITGAPGSGKSLLAARLSRCIVPTDAYLPDYDKVAYAERDLPAHADLERLARDLSFLRQGRDANIPVWSFHTHRREGFCAQSPSPIVVCEGIHALHDAALPHLDLLVYVEAPSEVRWERIAARERAGERGWGVEESRAFFESVAEPTFAAAAVDYRARAGVIVSNADARPAT
ncbi:MAG: AAA family ATPase [Phycisphaerae bacterium]|nr:AAA family ATPase [Phycisphaerae bacterium]